MAVNADAETEEFIILSSYVRLYVNSGKHDFNSLIAVYDFRSYFLPESYTRIIFFLCYRILIFYTDSVANSTAAELKKKQKQALV